MSRSLAAKGHFPAIDVLRSASRVAHQVTGSEARQLAAKTREVLARLEALQVFLDLGEYTPGIDPANDRAMACRDELTHWLRQDADDMSRPDETLRSLHELIG